MPACGDRSARGDDTVRRDRAGIGRPIGSTARSASTVAMCSGAANPVQGLLHTCQAIPENLLFANLGLTVQTTASQGVLLTAFSILAWTSRVWSRRRATIRPTAVRSARICRSGDDLRRLRR